MSGVGAYRNWNLASRVGENLPMCSGAKSLTMQRALGAVDRVSNSLSRILLIFVPILLAPCGWFKAKLLCEIIACRSVAIAGKESSCVFPCRSAVGAAMGLLYERTREVGEAVVV